MGRKKVTTKTKSDQKIDIRLRVDVDLERQIRDLAEQEGNSVAAFIRSAVVKEIRRRQKEAGE